MRSKLRFCVLVCFIILLSPVIVWVYLGSLVKINFFSTWAEILSLVPGMLGTWSRRAFYYCFLADCSSDVGIGFGTLFSKRNVKIAPGVSFGGYCIIGMCEIGEGTLFGSKVDILSGRHQHGSGDSLNQSKAKQEAYISVRIGKNCWIGNGTVIMNDIGDNCIIGAGSVVVHPIPPNSLAVGNPAVVKKSWTSK
jgi:acetyltransferase-like isoleucine patch superfamily enzyme